MDQKRIRMFAGPNGSGKTTLFNYIKNKGIPVYFYVNPDQIEFDLNRKKFINFNEYGLSNIIKEDFHKFLNNKNAFFKNFKDSNLYNIKIHNNILTIKNKIDSYAASIISEFIRYLFVRIQISFSFETVMSHKSKIEIIKKAIKKGYKLYLYFICTENPTLNTQRINERVFKKGHYVNQQKVKERYFRSLNLLPKCIPICDRAYIFDNSKTEIELIAEFENGKLTKLLNKNISWFNNLNLK
ncbi:MAG: hypothetical protein IAE65_09445 [Ignavibacteria bacterium]|nr:hypothetical protein [Ignavibacteria bacterium]